MISDIFFKYLHNIWIWIDLACCWKLLNWVKFQDASLLYYFWDFRKLPNSLLSKCLHMINVVIRMTKLTSGCVLIVIYLIKCTYLDRLLDTLTHALQSSGVDLSQASISVQIELGKQASIRPTVPISMCGSKVY